MGPDQSPRKTSVHMTECPKNMSLKTENHKNHDTSGPYRAKKSKERNHNSFL